MIKFGTFELIKNLNEIWDIDSIMWLRLEGFGHRVNVLCKWDRCESLGARK